MKFAKYHRYCDFFLIIASCLLLIFGSTKRFDNYTVILSIAGMLLVIVSWLMTGRKIRLPNTFKAYLIFLIFLIINCVFFEGKISYILMCLSGGLLWLLVYNLKETVSKYFFLAVTLLGIFLSCIFLWSIISGIYSTNFTSLYLPLYKGMLHNHLGDVWAVVLVGLFYKMFQKFQRWQILLAIVGILMVLISFSRSAILSLVVGSLYVYYKSDRRRLPPWTLTTIILVTASIFIYFGVFKTTLLSRPYIFESLSSLVKYPLGIGVGNFNKVSIESSATHNVILEFAAGMGAFSIIFIVWLLKVYKSLKEKHVNVLYTAMFLAIFVNFLFDVTYTIPTMNWLLFTTLALAIL